MEINDIGSVLMGKTIREIRGGNKGDDTMLLMMTDGTAYGFYHDQDCCEMVRIEDVCGDWSNILGSPLLQAEEVTSTAARPIDPFTGAQCELECEDSQTWTFYKFTTIKGGVTLRWLGESNGYYSESVDMVAFNVGQNIQTDFLKAPLLGITTK